MCKSDSRIDFAHDLATLSSEHIPDRHVNAAADDRDETRVAGGAPAAGLPVRRAEPMDPSTARVCVVMPVRNEAGYIGAALESVLAQTFDPRRTEIVVVDGMSEDDTAAIAHGLLRDH